MSDELLKTSTKNQLAIFNEIKELRLTMLDVIDAVEHSKTDKVSISNTDDLKQDLSSLQVNFKPVEALLKDILSDIPKMRDIDLTGIEILLRRLDKKPKDIDLSELKNITAILGTVVMSVQNLAEKEEEKTVPELKTIQKILDVINNNIISIDIPEIDYKRLAQIIKDNVNININGGGNSGAEIVALLQQILAKTGSTITLVDDLSASTDGATKVFTLTNTPTNIASIFITSSSFPYTYRPTTNFTFNGTTLTFDASVDAPPLGATLLVKYISTSLSSGNFVVDDLSGSTDGATKVFTLSNTPNSIARMTIASSDFPYTYRPTEDFTISGTTLTLTANVDAPGTATENATLLVQFYV